MPTPRLPTRLLCCLVTVVSGCFVPATVQVAPALSGRVLLSSGQPASGATVVITSPTGWQGAEWQKTVVADWEGRFRRREEVRWFLWILPADIFSAELWVHAERDGVRSAEHKVTAQGGARFFGLGKDAPVDLGDVYLVRP